MENKTITVKIDKAYGRTLIRPICPQAKLFASIARQATLTPEIIAKIKNLGFTVQVEVGPSNL